MRIVSLCPSLTELVFDLGRGPDLVGVTRYCVHPAEGVAAVEKVGGTKDPDLDRILALEPDLVLLNREENRREDAEALAEAGIHCHASLPRDCAQTARMVREIAAEARRSADGERIAWDIERRAARVREGARGKARVRWAYLVWHGPCMTVNDDTYAAALLNQAGGANAFGAHPDRYPRIEVRELAEAAPELVLLCTEPYRFREEHADGLAADTGLARERFRIADGEYLSWYGSRTPAGIDYAGGLIAAAR